MATWLPSIGTTVVVDSAGAAAAHDVNAREQHRCTIGIGGSRSWRRHIGWMPRSMSPSSRPSSVSPPTTPGHRRCDWRARSTRTSSPACREAMRRSPASDRGIEQVVAAGVACSSAASARRISCHRGDRRAQRHADPTGDGRRVLRRRDGVAVTLHEEPAARVPADRARRSRPGCWRRPERRRRWLRECASAAAGDAVATRPLQSYCWSSNAAVMARCSAKR